MHRADRTMLPQNGAVSSPGQNHALGTPSDAWPASKLLPNQGCALLRLPAELRDRIIEFAVVDTHSITISTNYFYPKDLGSAPPALSRTCHQLFEEVLAIYYKHNIFSLRIYSGGHEFHEVLQRLHNWLSCIEPAHRGMLGKIMICSNSQYEEHLQRILADVSDSICTGGHWESKTVGRGVVRRTWEVGEGDVVYWTWDGLGLDKPCSDRVCVDGQFHYWLCINGDGHKEAIERWTMGPTVDYATPWPWLLAKLEDVTGKRVARAATMASSALPVVQDCPLMRLPPELRDSIYELAVVEKYTLTISTILYDCNHQESHQPALAKTCRQLRNEVLAVYFRSNNFAIRVAMYFDPYVRELHDDFRSVYAWLSRMTAEHRRMLGKVIICSGMVGEEYHRSLFETVTAGLRAASLDGTVLWAWGGEKDDEKCIAWRHGTPTETGHYWLNIIGQFDTLGHS
ncbi:hypothetical protein LTR10_000881 [Elasticomyces elasticus]|nr:hypothetical protein LTR10_000881 [Elasticomyces elasticus]